uniref:Uncharacterized protein n=2 Tax=Cucumis melo TaxID=3656 RepID=A0A9I9DIH4_CUCME
MDDATSSMRMRDRDSGDWVRGDATCNEDRSFVDKHRLEQTQSTRFRFGRRDAEEMADGKGSGSSGGGGFDKWREIVAGDLGGEKRGRGGGGRVILKKKKKMMMRVGGCG